MRLGNVFGRVRLCFWLSVEDVSFEILDPYTSFLVHSTSSVHLSQGHRVKVKVTKYIHSRLVCLRLSVNVVIVIVVRPRRCLSAATYYIVIKLSRG